MGGQGNFGSGKGNSIDAVLVQPRAAGLVKLLHMIQVPGRQEPKERWEVEDFFVVDLFKRRVELCQQMMVCDSVVVDTREALLQQELLFALKVHLCEVDEAFELQVDLATVGSAQEHDAQIIQRIHEDAVLIIDGFTPTMHS